MSVLNGSTWTLLYEWQCYLIIGAAVGLGVFYRAKILIPILTLLALGVQIVSFTNGEVLAAVAPLCRP